MHRLAATITAAATAIAIVVVLMSIDFGRILPTLQELRPTTIAVVLLFLLLNFVLAYFRFERTLAALGASISWRTAARAFSLGTLASQFLLNIVGQSLTRAMVLQSAGVPMSLTVVATYVERLIALGLICVIAVIAAFVLYGSLGFELHQGGAYFLSLAAGISLTLSVAGIRAAAAVVTPAQLREIAATTVRLLPTVALNVLMLATMFSAYLVLALEFAPDVRMTKLAAAIIVVMFAAAMPISWAGWGLREFGAVYALGAIGMPSEAAVIVAVAIGAFSLLIMLVAGGVSLIEGWRRPIVGAAADRVVAATLPPADSMLFWPIGILVACLIYFQLRVPAGAEDLTLNVVDPLALTAFFFAGYLTWKDRFLSRFPRQLLYSVLALAVVLVVGAIVAWLQIGLTQWALLNRLFGFVILLGYAAVAGLVVSLAGERGRLILADAFVISGLLICGLQSVAYLVHFHVLPLPLDVFGYQFKFDNQLEGYAQNPNAFAFQLLMVLCVLVAFYPPDWRRAAVPWSLVGIIAIFAVVVIGHSRAGILSGGVVISLAFLLRLVPPHLSLRRGQWAVLLLASIGAIVLAIAFHSSIYEFVIEPLNARWRANANASDVLRWQTIAAGTQQWLQHPVLGHGLGSFLLERQRAGETALVIHSVPIWFLAEMGLGGLSAYVFFVVSLLRWGLVGGQQNGRARVVVMAVTLFVLMGLVHDIFYQRTFWFGLGLLLTSAIPIGGKSYARSPACTAQAGTEAAA